MLCCLLWCFNTRPPRAIHPSACSITRPDLFFSSSHLVLPPTPSSPALPPSPLHPRVKQLFSSPLPLFPRTQRQEKGLTTRPPAFFCSSFCVRCVPALAPLSPHHHHHHHPSASSAASLDVPRPGLLNSSRRLALASRVPTTMPVSIEELDSTVRTFYEGRGDQVRSPLVRSPNFEANVVLMPVSTAKSRPGRLEPGKRFPRPHTTPAARRRHSKRRRRSNQSSQRLSLSAVC